MCGVYNSMFCNWIKIIHKYLNMTCFVLELSEDFPSDSKNEVEYTTVK